MFPLLLTLVGCCKNCENEGYNVISLAISVVNNLGQLGLGFCKRISNILFYFLCFLCNQMHDVVMLNWIFWLMKYVIFDLVRL